MKKQKYKKVFEMKELYLKSGQENSNWVDLVNLINLTKRIFVNLQVFDSSFWIFDSRIKHTVVKTYKDRLEFKLDEGQVNINRGYFKYFKIIFNDTIQVYTKDNKYVIKSYAKEFQEIISREYK